MRLRVQILHISKTFRRCMGFYASYVTPCTKPSQNFIIASTCDIMTPRQVSWFSDFVCILYNLKTTRQQVSSHVSWRRCTRVRVCSWIRPHITLNNMYINFPFIELHYWMHLQFKFAFSEKNQWNEINWRNIGKNLRNVQNLNMYSHLM
jgi:hypothetical protein